MTRITFYGALSLPVWTDATTPRTAMPVRFWCATLMGLWFVRPHIGPDPFAPPVRRIAWDKNPEIPTIQRANTL